MNIYEERIAPLFTQTGKNDKELETIIGLPKGIIYNWKSGRSKNFEAYIPQISKYFHISADYLMGIDTPKSPVKAEVEKEAPDQKSNGEDAQLAQLIAGFSRLSSQQKSAVLAVIEGYQPSQE